MNTKKPKAKKSLSKKEVKSNRDRTDKAVTGVLPLSKDYAAQSPPDQSWRTFVFILAIAVGALTGLVISSKHDEAKKQEQLSHATPSPTPTLSGVFNF